MDMDSLRKEIDEADAQLLDAFQRRMRLALDVGRQKMAAGRPITDPARERQVRERALQRCDKDLRQYVEPLYNTLLSLSRDYQRRALAPAGHGDA